MTGELELLASMVRTACQGEPDLIERIKKAMKESKTHFMFGAHPEDLRFRGALGAAMLESNEEEKARIVTSLRPLQTLSALQSGVLVDMDEFARQMEEPNLIPLMKLWHETPPVSP